MTGRALKRTPLHECHVEAGARLVPFVGWEMPVQYRGVIEEHRAVRTRWGVRRLAHGRDRRCRPARLAIQYVTCNDAQAHVRRAHHSG
jgi:aminomethyltransferase